MLALIAMLLATDPPTCDAGVDCSGGGFKSQAALHYGSGTPDFVCGNRHTLEDGGWGSGSKYCLIETHESEAYDQGHGDLTIASKYPRSAGLLTTWQNPYFGSGAIVSYVDYAGNFGSYGTYYAYGNGGGFRNDGYYAGIYGRGTNLMPDVVIGTPYGHSNGRWNVGIWNGYEWTFLVRDDGRVYLDGQVLGFDDVGEGIVIRKELPDGGTKNAFISWSNP